MQHIQYSATFCPCAGGWIPTDILPALSRRFLVLARFRWRAFMRSEHSGRRGAPGRFVLLAFAPLPGRVGQHTTLVGDSFGCLSLGAVAQLQFDSFNSFRARRTRVRLFELCYCYIVILLDTRSPLVLHAHRLVRRTQ